MPERDLGPGPAATFREHLARIDRGEIAQAIADYDDAVLHATEVGSGAPAGVVSGIFHGREAILYAAGIRPG